MTVMCRNGKNLNLKEDANKTLKDLQIYKNQTIFQLIRLRGGC
jgi:hypothetical protein